MFKKIFSRPGKAEAVVAAATPTLQARFSEQGVLFPIVSQAKFASLPLQDKDLAYYLAQLDEEEYLTELSGDWLLTWESLYRLLGNEEHATSTYLLQLPPVVVLKPTLGSEGGLTDANFKVVVRDWCTADGEPVQGGLQRIGARVQVNGQSGLLPYPAWKLLQAVRQFYQEQQESPGESTNQIGWSGIRKLAKACDARLDGFLTGSIVIRPEALQLLMRKSQLEDAPVIELEPMFEGAPEGWLASFDRLQQVQDRYHINCTDGSVVHVLITPEVKSVLTTVRRMPGRRVSGDEALTFLRNPYAVLGDDAVQVLDEEEYRQGREDAGIFFYRFSLLPVLDVSNRIDHVNLKLEPLTERDQVGVNLSFSAAHEFAPLVRELEVKLAAGQSCGFWKGYELELGDFDLSQLQGMQALLERWQQEAMGQLFADVLDLNQYGDRVIGIGIAEKVTSPFLVKESTENWLPAELLGNLGLDGELLSKWDKSNRQHFDEFNRRIALAEAGNVDSVILPGLELELPRKVAVALRDAWSEKFKEVEGGGDGGEKPEKVILQIKHNIDDPDYVSTRVQSLELPDNAHPNLPVLLRDDIKLREHQLHGVAWLQHLFNLSPLHVTGCVLADDMGLGKTLQLLTFITASLEQAESGNPVLIIAPVSLLDNWERELQRFFHADNLPLLKLYGKALAELKLNKRDIPTSLQQKGIQNLLKPGWLGEARIVLTTYETLRDQEFSLARQCWSIVVCDEAQKIKNPAAMLTQAAKAVPARFRVACTGTPVENSLTDLWCLFDFVQPGLLGSLNEFGRSYSRPIECKSEQDTVALERLRQLIAPQLLRRTKADIAKDLPPKREDERCRALPISRLQHELYHSEVRSYEQKKQLVNNVGEQNVAILGLLHTLKMICAHPHAVRPQGELLDVSPKMAWLMRKLEEIKSRGEKVIIFTELRDIQRSLQQTVCERFGIDVTVINGDTSASSERGNSRQGLIDRFQQLSGFGVIILSTTAVGFGVNVQAANHVIHFTRSWNPAKEDQATDRAYRIGQTREVHVYYPTIVADGFTTFEKTLDTLLSGKRKLAGDMLNGAGELDIREFVS